ncbi:MAG: TRAP transporter small permease [Pseudomonadota bacterium]
MAAEKLAAAGEKPPAPKPVRAALAVADALTAVGAAVGAVAALGLAAMLIVEVITTSFFAYSQPYAVEYSGYLLGLVLFAGTGWTLGKGGHIRVEVLADILGSERGRLLDLVTSVFALGVVGFVALALTRQALRTWELGSRSYFPSETPLVYPQAMLAAGFILLTIAFVARIVRLFVGLPAQDARPITEEA